MAVVADVIPLVPWGGCPFVGGSLRAPCHAVRVAFPATRLAEASPLESSETRAERAVVEGVSDAASRPSSPLADEGALTMELLVGAVAVAPYMNAALEVRLLSGRALRVSPHVMADAADAGALRE